MNSKTENNINIAVNIHDILKHQNANNTPTKNIRLPNINDLNVKVIAAKPSQKKSISPKNMTFVCCDKSIVVNVVCGGT